MPPSAARRPRRRRPPVRRRPPRCCRAPPRARARRGRKPMACSSDVERLVPRQRGSAHDDLRQLLAREPVPVELERARGVTGHRRGALLPGQGAHEQGPAAAQDHERDVALVPVDEQPVPGGVAGGDRLRQREAGRHHEARLVAERLERLLVAAQHLVRRDRHDRLLAPAAVPGETCGAHVEGQRLVQPEAHGLLDLPRPTPRDAGRQHGDAHGRVGKHQRDRAAGEGPGALEHAAHARAERLHVQRRSAS